MAEFCGIRRGFGSSKNEESEKAKMMECVRFGGRQGRNNSGPAVIRQGSSCPDTITNFMTVPHSRFHDLILVSYTR
jgi:hypothetical protein